MFEIWSDEFRLVFQEAIAADSYLHSPTTIENGDVAAGFEEADIIVKGEQRMRGQEHFYLEPTGALAIPNREDDGMEMIVSSQSPTSLQVRLWI